MANVTRIKAKDSSSDRKSEKTSDAEVTRKVSIKAKNSENTKAKAAKKSAEKAKEKQSRKDKAAKEKKNIPAILKPLWFISTPFRALGRYIRDSFRELRQVRFPDRKTTWKITLSVIVFIIVAVVVFTSLDAGLRFAFDKLLNLGGNN